MRYKAISDAVGIMTANADARYVSANYSGGVTINGSLYVNNRISANTFVGDGSALTGLFVTANADARADARYVSQNHTGAVTINGRLYVNNTVSANSFIGDGVGLTGLPVYLVTANADLRYVSPNYSQRLTVNALSVVNTINAGWAVYLNEFSNLGIVNSGVVGFNYSGNSFDRRLRITAGRDDTADNTQGASVDLHGNNHSTKPGDFDAVAGTGGSMSIWTGGSQRVIVQSDGSLVIPRFAKAARPSNAIAGTIIFQTDNTPGLRVYNGTNWMKFTEATDD